MALPRANRLSLRFEREHLTKTGKTVYGKFFTLVFADSSMENSPLPRLAILLSKKTASQAVDRNKIKRITSSIIEPILSSLSVGDYLIIPKKDVLVKAFKALQLDFQEIISKIQ